MQHDISNLLPSYLSQVADHVVEGVLVVIVENQAVLALQGVAQGVVHYCW
jgi:hypothetical protein